MEDNQLKRQNDLTELEKNIVLLTATINGLKETFDLRLDNLETNIQSKFIQLEKQINDQALSNKISELNINDLIPRTKEQGTRIKTLTDEVAALKNEITSLKQEILTLKNEKPRLKAKLIDDFATVLKNAFYLSLTGGIIGFLYFLISIYIKNPKN